MKLYGWISNDKHICKTQGGQKVLFIELDYEELGQSYHDNTNAHRLELVFHWTDGEDKPQLKIWGNPAIKVEDKRLPADP